MKDAPARKMPKAVAVTPGGFHSFEHRWALDEAFKFHLGIGKPRIAERIHVQNDQLKEGLARMPHVVLRTPRSRELSAGIVCFDVKGMKPDDVVERLREDGVMASVTPYATKYVRLAPSLVTSPADIDTALGKSETLKMGLSTRARIARLSSAERP
jgi:isopenicillin-N epimerase